MDGFKNDAAIKQLGTYRHRVGDGSTICDLIHATNNGGYLTPRVESFLTTSKEFSLAQEAQVVEIAVFSILHPDATARITDQTVLNPLLTRGFVRPTAEDALRFLILHHDVFFELPVLFLHPSWDMRRRSDPNRKRKYQIAFTRNKGERSSLRYESKGKARVNEMYYAMRCH